MNKQLPIKRFVLVPGLPKVSANDLASGTEGSGGNLKDEKNALGRHRRDQNAGLQLTE